MRKKGQGTSGDQCFFWVMFDTFKKYIKHPAIWQHWTFYRLVVSSCHKLHDNWLVNGDQAVDGFKLFPNSPNIYWNMNGIQGWTQKLWIYTMNTQPLHYYAITTTLPAKGNVHNSIQQNIDQPMSALTGYAAFKYWLRLKTGNVSILSFVATSNATKRSTWPRGQIGARFRKSWLYVQLPSLILEFQKGVVKICSSDFWVGEYPLVN